MPSRMHAPAQLLAGRLLSNVNKAWILGSLQLPNSFRGRAGKLMSDKKAVFPTDGCFERLRQPLNIQKPFAMRSTELA